MTDEPNVRRLFGTGTTRGEVGIEIEMEISAGDFWYPGDGNAWRLEGDGSLRGASGEYVLNRPVDRKDVPNALIQLWEELNHRGANIRDSIRAGVHIHMNMQEMTLKQVRCFAACYYTLEELLVDWCGDNRVGNHFCLRALDAEFVIDYVSAKIRNKHYGDLHNDRIRYAALNWKALPQYGSLEFRSMQTSRDWQRIHTWTEMLLSIKDFSLKYNDPLDIINDFSVKGAENWAQEALSTHHKQILVDKRVDQKLMTGMRISQDFVYLSQ